MDYSPLLGLLFALLFSVFFSGIEVAFLSADKLRIELLGKQGKPAGQILAFFIDRPTWFIGITLVGNIASLIFFGLFATEMLLPWLSTTLQLPELAMNAILVVFAVALTIIVLYTVEYLSKSFFIIRATTLLRALSIPFVIVSTVIFPLVYLIISLAKLVSVHVLKLEYSMDRPVFGLTNVAQYLRSIQPVQHVEHNFELDKKIFRNALQFRSVRVRDCMIPRTEITAVDLRAGIQKLHDIFVESGHSKIIIFKETIDDVIGYCHSSALFKKPSRIEDILTPIITVPEAMLAKDLMVKFINERKSLASVIDEFGGTSGIVSMEDVIEEIFGEIEDEHDEDYLIEQQLTTNAWLLSARLEIDYLNETHHWQLPVGEYDTLGGLVLSFTEDLPKPGQTVKIDRYTLIVQATSQNRINTVRLVIEDSDSK